MLPWGFHDTLEYYKVKCYTGEFCALAEYLFRLSIRDTNKHFWRRCRGSNWLKLSYNWVENLTILSPLVLAGLLLLFLSRLFDAEQCMTGFDLPSNFDPNPQRIGRIVRRCVVPPQKKPTWNPRLSVSAPPMAKTLRQYSAPSSSHIPTGLNNDQGNDGFELKSGQVNS